MAQKFGYQCKLYVCAAGIGGTPTWTEVTAVNGDLRLTEGGTEVDLSTRASPIAAAGRGMGELAVEFDMIDDSAAAGYSEIATAFSGRSILGVRVLDGSNDVAGSAGWEFDAAVLRFDRNEQLKGHVIRSISMKPTYSTNVPAAVLIAE